MGYLTWIYTTSLVLCLCEQVFMSADSDDKLYNDLMGRKSGYNKNIRPYKKPGDNVTVQFGIALPEIINLGEKDGKLYTRAWLRMSWVDYRLSWDPRDYNDVEVMHIPAKNIWLPDITLYNGYDIKIDTDFNVIIYSNGNILWVPPMTFYSTCVHQFRTDSWTCPLKFGSWTFDGSKLDIVPYEGKTDMDMNDYLSNPHWSLLDQKGERKTKTYSCCAETYVSMEYALVLRSKIGLPIIYYGKRNFLSLPSHPKSFYS